jgi:hypothetical protein
MQGEVLMPGIVDVFGNIKKSNVMKDTWGHTYPDAGRKYPGYIVFSVGDYGDCNVLKAEFADLSDSPMKAEVCCQIFDDWEVETGVYRVDCELWFYKNCHNMYISRNPIGKIIKQKIKSLVDI